MGLKVHYLYWYRPEGTSHFALLRKTLAKQKKQNHELFICIFKINSTVYVCHFKLMALWSQSWSRSIKYAVPSLNKYHWQCTLELSFAHLNNNDWPTVTSCKRWIDLCNYPKQLLVEMQCYSYSFPQWGRQQAAADSELLWSVLWPESAASGLIPSIVLKPKHWIKCQHWDKLGILQIEFMKRSRLCRVYGSSGLFPVWSDGS